MIRGTTAQFKFKMPYRIDELAWVGVKFWQNGNRGTLESPLPITKEFMEPTLSENQDPYRLVVTLSPGETKRFSDKLKARVQLKAVLKQDGTSFGSKEQLITVYPMEDDIIDGIPDIGTPNEEGYVILDGESIV